MGNIPSSLLDDLSEGTNCMYFSVFEFSGSVSFQDFLE